MSTLLAQMMNKGTAHRSLMHERYRWTADVHELEAEKLG